MGGGAMMTKKTNARVFAVCSLVLLWSLISAAGARADRNDFHNNGDGTIYDAKTGLTWHQDGSDDRHTWQEALAYVDALNAGSGYGGCRGWHLPTSKELDRLVDHSKHSGWARIDTDYFPTTKNDYYWSSSSHKNTLKYATSFGDGHKRKRSSSNRYYVRAVRGDCDPTDNDGDSYLPEVDCNDNDPNINPGAVERCDGLVDNNCDGILDLTCWDVDNDLDGQTENQGDCDDRDPNNYTGNPEVCDGMDNDCDTMADNGLTFDADGDGYTSIGSCAGSADDCNDASADVNPGVAEICGDLIDQNCDGDDLSCLDVDNDGDGQTENAGDCDDTDPANFTGNTEVCDGADNDCIAGADNGLFFTTYYRDSDGDSYGNATVSQSTCNGASSGYVADSTDCDDTAAAVNPGAAEVTCDGMDNDCNAATLDAPDGDGDGSTVCADCNDADANSFPGNTETCDNIDNNCDGSVDENLTQPTSCGVGACAGNTGEESCTAGTWGGDTCDPYAGATAETCDGSDNNCNGQIDEGVKTTFYQDFDSDAFGNPSVTADACSQPSGYVADNTDCDDTKANVNPSVAEICGDGIDQDCIGGDQVCSAAGVQLGSGGSFDFIQDAFDAIATGGTDTIKMKSLQFGESLSFYRNVITILAGGYDDSFTISNGWTIISSSLGPAMVISNGTVIIEYVILR